MALEIYARAGADHGRAWPLLPGARIEVGRAEGCALRLNDARVSRRHCALELRPQGLWVEDLGGRGGTRLLGRPLRKEGCLAPGEVGARIELGTTVLEVREAAAKAPAEGAGAHAPRVEGYALERKLGAGAGGTIFSARHLETGRRVALKLLNPGADAESRKRFQREASLAGRLDHPSIASILGHTLDAEGRPCLIRELVEGEALDSFLAREGPLHWRGALVLGARLADALAHAHERGVIHRDVKPANVIGTARGAKLIDFDLARILHSPVEATLTQLTQTGQGLGTLAYLPPEQLQDARHAGPRSDLYGLGATLFHVLVGAPPFADVEQDQFLRALVEVGPGSLQGRVRGAPLAALLAVERAYALDAQDRYESAGAMAEALRQHVER